MKSRRVVSSCQIVSQRRKLTTASCVVVSTAWPLLGGPVWARWKYLVSANDVAASATLFTPSRFVTTRHRTQGHQSGRLPSLAPGAANIVGRRFFPQRPRQRNVGRGKQYHDSKTPSKGE